MNENELQLKRIATGSYPSLKSVDNNVVRPVANVQCHKTQVGEIPKELKKKTESYVIIFRS